MISQLSCGEELWVAAHDLLLSIALGVGKVDIVAQYLKETLRLVHSTHDGPHLVNAALSCWVFVVYLLPSIVMLIRCIGRAELGIVACSITNARKGAVPQ